VRPTHRCALVFLTLLGILHVFTAVAQNSPFPLDTLSERAREKIDPVLEDYTLKRVLELEHRILNRPLHQFLLDRPDVGAAIARGLGIGNYTVTRKEKDLFYGVDPDGVEGNLEILYRDEGHRVYFAQGTAEGAVLTVRGKLLMLHESQYRTTDQGQMSVQTQLTIYAKIENPFLAFLLKLFAPLIGDLADPKLSKAQGVVRQVSERIVEDPQGTYSRIVESDQVACEDLTILHKLISRSAPLVAKKGEPC